jgi:hypothetical protein
MEYTGAKIKYITEVFKLLTVHVIYQQGIELQKAGWHVLKLVLRGGRKLSVETVLINTKLFKVTASCTGLKG